MSRLIETGHGGCASRLDVGQMDRSFVPPSVHHYSARGTIVATKPRDGSIHVHLRFVPRTAHPRGRARHRPDHAPAGHRHEARTHRVLHAQRGRRLRYRGSRAHLRHAWRRALRVRALGHASCARRRLHARMGRGRDAAHGVEVLSQHLRVLQRAGDKDAHDGRPRSRGQPAVRGAHDAQAHAGHQAAGDKGAARGWVVSASPGAFGDRTHFCATSCILRGRHRGPHRRHSRNQGALLREEALRRGRCRRCAQVCRGGRRWRPARQGARIRARHARERDQGHRSARHDHRRRRREPR